MSAFQEDLRQPINVVIIVGTKLHIPILEGSTTKLCKGVKSRIKESMVLFGLIGDVSIPTLYEGRRLRHPHRVFLFRKKRYSADLNCSVSLGFNFLRDLRNQ